MSLPQLRVRSGYSFRDAYGRIPDVLARMKEVHAHVFGMVDTTTWGHVKMEQAAKKADIAAAFGFEFPLQGIRTDFDFLPRAWMLATDSRKFYNLTSLIAKDGMTSTKLAEATGVVRFLGGAAFSQPHPDAIDYVDLNPSSILGASQSIEYAFKHQKPLILTSYNDMLRKEDAHSAYAWEVRESVGLRHICTLDEIRDAIGHLLTHTEFYIAAMNTHTLAAQLGHLELAKAPIIHLAGDLLQECRDGQCSRLNENYITDWTDEYEKRLLMELEQINLKQFDSYFLMVGDLVRYAKQHMLVGPARGSSAGSLVCYLLRITEIDPVKHNLLFHRFIDISRTDFPDIDIDFPDTKRHLVFEYLRKKYGEERVSKLGNLNQLQPFSILAQIGKKFGISIDETMMVRRSLVDYAAGDARYGHSLEDTMLTTSGGQEFKERYPAAGACMEALELHPSHMGVHAGGALVCNDPISDFCTVNERGEACVDKNDAEYLNLLKMDLLGLRTLGILEDANVLTQDQFYRMPLDDRRVLDILNEDRVSGIFQFEGDAVRGITRQVPINTFEKIDNLTSLARPGPMGAGMVPKYVNRAAGREKVTYDIPELEHHLKSSYGILLYQEQCMSIVREMGLFDWATTSEVRRAIGKSKGAEYLEKYLTPFIEGATSQGISETGARKIWQEMVNFGAYGFNRSHSVAYAMVTYWTCYLKRYHTLEFAAACLRSAKDDVQVIAILRELVAEGVNYTAIDPEYSDMNWLVADGRLIGGIQNAKGFGPAKSMQYVQKRQAGTLTDKDRERLAKSEIKYSDLNEAHTKFGAYYAHPESIGVTSGSRIINIRAARDEKTVVVIGKLTKKTLLDENEAARIKKRAGKRYKGPSEFVDFYMSDDSTDAPFRCRIRPELYPSIGRQIFEEAPAGSWFLIKGRKLADIDMIIVKKIKRID